MQRMEQQRCSCNAAVWPGDEVFMKGHSGRGDGLVSKWVILRSKTCLSLSLYTFKRCTQISRNANAQLELSDRACSDGN